MQKRLKSSIERKRVVRNGCDWNCILVIRMTAHLYGCIILTNISKFVKCKQAVKFTSYNIVKKVSDLGNATITRRSLPDAPKQGEMRNKKIKK